MKLSRPVLWPVLACAIGCGGGGGGGSDTVDAAAPPVDADTSGGLRPAGPPEVVAILARSEIRQQETAAYCRYVGGALDAFAPGTVAGTQLCPPTEAAFVPARLDPRAAYDGTAMRWGLRVVLDERLNRDAVSTPDALKPGLVTLTCGAGATPVAVTGVYSELGDRASSPPGPSVLIKPDAAAVAVAPGTSCTVTLDAALVDETGEPIPADQRTHTVRLEEFGLDTIDMGANGASTSDLGGTATHVFAFNASLAEETIDSADFQILDATSTPVTAAIQVRWVDDWAIDEDQVEYELFDGAFFRVAPYLAPGPYTARLTPGATIGALHGGTMTADTSGLSQAFTVAYGFVSSTPANGAGVPVGTPPEVPGYLPAYPLALGAGLSLRFNGAVDASTLTAAGFTLKDANGVAVPFTVAAGAPAPADVITITPGEALTPDITYTLSILAGTTITWSGTCPSGSSPRCQADTLTAARSIRFRVE